MKLVFNMAFDGEPWPGPMGYGETAREVVLGEDWVGPMGLLGLLETQLGLGGRHPSSSERAIELLPRVSEKEGFWEKSAEADPLGVTRVLIGQRDYLAMHGWEPKETKQKKGKATKVRRNGRMAELASLTEEILPGVPDRLRLLIAELEECAVRQGARGIARLDLEEVTLLGQPREALPWLWGLLLTRLEEAGVKVSSLELPLREARTGRRNADLVRCLEPGFVPKGDGSLQLVRVAGPLAAAEVLAAYLASLDEQDIGDGTVIIGGDHLLDAALAGQGLPAVGGPSLGDTSPIMAVLPLGLGLLWNPRDPEVALALLGLPTSPIDWRLRWRLRDALGEWPAVGSEAWEQKLAEGLAKIEGEAKRRRARQRVAAIFEAEVFDDQIPVAALLERVKVVEAWARQRAWFDWARRGRTADPLLDEGDVDRDGDRDEGSDEVWDEDSDDPRDEDRREAEEPALSRGHDWSALIAGCVVLRDLIQAGGLTSVDPIELDRLLGEVDAAVGGGRRQEAQAGIRGIRSPAQLAGPARRVIWWSFTRAEAERPHSLSLPTAEVAALTSEGARLPSPAEQAARHREAWLRPFTMATEEVLLVCPYRDVSGEEAFPHPIWDEIVAGLAPDEEAKLVRRAPGNLAPEKKMKPLAQPMAAGVWRVGGGGAAPLPEKLSPSQLGDWIGCPLKKVLSATDELNAVYPPGLCSGSTLYGLLAHKVFERLLGDRSAKLPRTPKDTRTRVKRIIDEEWQQRAATLYQGGAEAARADLERRVTEAAVVLVSAIASVKATVEGVEVRFERTWKGRPLNGNADLVLSDPDMILDYKWSSTSYWRKSLAAGAGYQLAAYTYQKTGGRGAAPALGILVVRNGQLVMLGESKIPGALSVNGPPFKETWAAVERSLDEVLGQLERGEVVCGGTPEPPAEVLEDAVIDEEGCLRIPPGCRFCDFGAICRTEVE